MNTLGDRLRAARLSHVEFHKSMKSLANAAGITLQHMRHIELDITFPSEVVLERLVDLLQLDADAKRGIWLIYAKRRLGPITLKNIEVRPIGDQAERAADAATEWFSTLYDFSDEDELDLRNHIRKALKE